MPRKNLYQSLVLYKSSANIISWYESFSMLAFHFQSSQGFLPVVSISLRSESCTSKNIVVGIKREMIRHD